MDTYSQLPMIDVKKFTRLGGERQNSIQTTILENRS